MVEIEGVTERTRPLRTHADAIFVWGSVAEARAHERSDVDVCVVAGPGRDWREVWRVTLAQSADPRLDVKVFEELPLYLKAEVLERGDLVWARDAPALSEYLRKWSKEWAHQAHRNRMTEDDVRRMLAARASTRGAHARVRRGA